MGKKININEQISIYELIKSMLKERTIVLGFDYAQNIVMERLFENKTVLVQSNGFQVKFKAKTFYYILESITPDSQEVIAENISKNLTFNLNSSLFFDFIKEEVLFLTLSIRKCKIGEYYDVTSFFCLPCQPNTFLFLDEYLEASICKSCAGENFYCYGGFQISPKRQYWRKSENSTIFLRCPNEGILKF